MIMEWISWALLALGSAFVVVGAFGVIRMPDLYTRMHAASVTETLGAILILAGLMVHTGWSLATFKLFAIFLFLLFTAPVASYAMANAAMIGGLKPQLAPDSREETAP